MARMTAYNSTTSRQLWWIFSGIFYLLLNQISPCEAQATTLRISVINHPPLIERKGQSFEGLAIDLMNRICEKEGFIADYREVADGKYGRDNGTGYWNGMIGEVIRDEADVALGPLSIIANREEVIDYTVPWYDLVGIRVLMKKKKYPQSLWRFMTVMEPWLWLSILGSFFVTAILLWFFDVFSPSSYRNNKFAYEDDDEVREFTIIESMWFCASSLTPQGGGDPPKNTSGKAVAATWWVFSFIIVASYTANLAAFLTINRLNAKMSGISDLLIQYKVKYAPVESSDVEYYFRSMSKVETSFYDDWRALSQDVTLSPGERAKYAVWEYPVNEQYTALWKYMEAAGLRTTSEEAIKDVLASPSDEEGFAYISLVTQQSINAKSGFSSLRAAIPFSALLNVSADAVTARYATMSNCDLEEIGEEFARRPYAMVVRQGNDALRKQLSKAIQDLRSDYVLDTLKQKWWTKNRARLECPLEDDESNGVPIGNMGGIFIVIGIGIFTALIVLLMETQMKRAPKNLPPQQKQIVIPASQVKSNSLAVTSDKTPVDAISENSKF